VLAATLGLALATACDVGSPSTTPTPTMSTPETSTSTSTTASPSGTPVEVTAYYVGTTTRGFRLFKERRTVTTTESAPVTALVTALEGALDPDYQSVWKSLGVAVNSVTKSRGTIAVDLQGISGLRSRPAGMKASFASASVDQILWTVKDAFSATDKVAVQILSDGSPVDRLLGVPVAEPLAFPDPGLSLAQVWITNLEEGDSVTSPVRVKGLGAAFEGQIVWRVYDESGQLVKKGWTLAEDCCRMAPYSFKVRLTPGTYTIVVEDTDPSGGEAPGPWQDSKTITVS
jgi:hypothetical protein